MQINLRGGCAGARPTRTIQILRAGKTDETSPRECTTAARTRRVASANMLEIASAVLFENFNCIVELSHECFPLPENNTESWNAVLLSWRIFCLILLTRGPILIKIILKFLLIVQLLAKRKYLRSLFSECLKHWVSQTYQDLCHYSSINKTD